MKETELLRINKKYSIKYILIAKMFEVYIIFFIFILTALLSHKIVVAVGFVFFLILIALITLIFSKRNAARTCIIFYDSKIIYRRYFLFKDIEKEMSYDKVKDIVFSRGTNWITRICQKLFHFGNIYIYPKKGNIIINGISLEVVENIEQVISDIKECVGDKIK